MCCAHSQTKRKFKIKNWVKNVERTKKDNCWFDDEKNTKNQSTSDEGCGVRNPQFKFKETLQRPSQNSHRVRSSSKLNLQEPMEVDMSSIHANIGVGSDKTKGKFNPAVKREFSKNSQRKSQPYEKKTARQFWKRKNRRETSINQQTAINQKHNLRSDKGERLTKSKNCSKPLSGNNWAETEKRFEKRFRQHIKNFLKRKIDQLSFERHDKQTGKKTEWFDWARSFK